ncbi:uncharacterized protein LOC134776503 [Penaeus indicus]|uniref:uncharacterized protein LOC134776503 n=1 Tax=Penaeus indicus TaxID=29960 RepID=UPI00300CC9CC
MEKKIDMLCVQETRWQGQKARELGEGYKLYYMGVDNRRNGAGLVLRTGMKEGVTQVNRGSDSVMWLKIVVGEATVNFVCVYAPQVGCTNEEKDDFWDLLGDTMLKVPEGEEVGDLNGHVGEGSRNTEVTERYGVGTRNEGGDKIVDFATARSLAIVNTYFQKKLTRRVTYTIGGQNTEVVYIMCRRNEL